MHDDDDDDCDDDRLIWWEPLQDALGVIIDCLDLETRQRITDRLRLTAVCQQDKKLKLASFFSRALSGEPYPGAGQPVPRLSLDAELEKRLTKDFNFQDYLQPQPQPQPGEAPRGILWTLAKPPADDAA
jgi:hypothetical protein